MSTIAAISFALVEVLSTGENKIRVVNLGWTKPIAMRKLTLALDNNLRHIRLALVDLDYKGMGSFDNVRINKFITK